MVDTIRLLEIKSDPRADMVPSAAFTVRCKRCPAKPGALPSIPAAHRHENFEL